MRGARAPGRAAWTTAGAASLAAHAVLLGLAIWLLGRGPPPVEAPTLNVQLVTLTPRAAAEPQRSNETQPPPTLQNRAPTRIPRAPVDSEIAPLPLAPLPATGDPGAAVARALRGRLGCRAGDAKAAEDRERCAAMLTEAGAARDGARPKLDFSRQGRIGEAPGFDLSRRPKNGCRIRTAGDKGAHGKDGGRAGFACAWDF